MWKLGKMRKFQIFERKFLFSKYRRNINVRWTAGRGGGRGREGNGCRYMEREREREIDGWIDR